MTGARHQTTIQAPGLGAKSRPTADDLENDFCSLDRGHTKEETAME